MPLSRYAVAVAVVLTAAAMTHAPQARALASVSTAVGSCLGNVQASEMQLRKRPLGIRNEGTSGAFVSCATQWGYRPGASPSTYVTATNLSTTAVDFTCTLVDGYPLPYQVPNTIRYHPKTISLAPGSTARLAWVPSDYYFSGTSFTNYENFSCYLPPGIEINDVGFDYTSYDAWTP